MIQQRLQDALEKNPNIDTIQTNATEFAGDVFIFNRDTYNEINMYAVYKLAQDPYIPIEQIWQEWAENRFGKKAAKKVISALKRTNDIGNLTYYIEGIWVQNHSLISDLPYLENHLLCYSKNMLRWKPDDFRMKALIREVVDNPREHTIEWVVADRQEALRLSDLSLKDIESAKKDLPKAEYKKLKYQLTLQRRFVETSIPHIESFLRYRIQKKTPSAENLEKLEKALKKLEKKGDEVEKIYKEKAVILTAKDIRLYVKQVREALAKI